MWLVGDTCLTVRLCHGARSPYSIWRVGSGRGGDRYDVEGPMPNDGLSDTRFIGTYGM
jgi:hypothetical protein